MSLGGFGLNPFQDINKLIGYNPGGNLSPPAYQSWTQGAGAGTTPSNNTAVKGATTTNNSQSGSGAMFGDNNGAGAYTTPTTPAGPSALYTSGLNNVLSSSGLAAQNAALGEGTSINDYIDSVKNQQRTLDQQGVQNYLAKQQGNKGILDWVGQGIRSGGVMLAGKNASNSSAAEALAKAYSTLGRNQAAGVNQQFAQGQNQVAQGQQTLQSDMAAHIRDLPAWKTQTVNSIVSNAQQQLQTLNQYLAYANPNEQVDINAQKQAISDQTLQALQGLDQALAGVNNVQPASTDQLTGQANTLFQAGTAPAAPFSFSTSAPAQFQNTGPAASDLPLYTAPSNNTKNQLQPAF